MTSKASEAAAKRTNVEAVGTERSSRPHPGRDIKFSVWQYGGSRRGTSAASRALGLLAGNELANLVNLLFRFRVNTKDTPHLLEPLGGLNFHEHCHDCPRYR
jgi:hypothetical protein